MNNQKPLRWWRRPDETRPELHVIRRGAVDLGKVVRYGIFTIKPFYQGEVKFGTQAAVTKEFETLEEAKAATRALVLKCEAREAALPPIKRDRLDLLAFCYGAMKMLNTLDNEDVKRIEDTLEALHVSPHRLPEGMIQDGIVAVLSHGGYGSVKDVIDRIRRKFEADK